MTPENDAHSAKAVWAAVAGQDGAVHRDQLLAAGLTDEAIRHRVQTGRLHPKWPRVFAVGRPHLSRRGTWIAALLTCGDAACLSHGSAIALYEIGAEQRGIEISVPRSVRLRRVGIAIHQRRGLRRDHVCEYRGIRVTTPALALIDFASNHARHDVEAAINEADRRDLIDPETLRTAVDAFASWRGAPLLRDVLDRLTFTLTDSELERAFLPIARRAGLGPPLTRVYVNGYRVDFYWPELGLVVETDGLRYHRTASRQMSDRRRDQAHTAAGLTPLRFTHGQIHFEAKYVEATLRTVAERLSGPEAVRAPGAPPQGNNGPTLKVGVTFWGDDPRKRRISN
jgi:hypothetical protein